MKITIACVGRVKEKFFRDAIAEYSKRLSRYAKLDIVEVKDEKTPENASDAEERKIKETEGKRLLEKIPDSAYVIALAIQGEMLTSERLAARIERLGLEPKFPITPNYAWRIVA